MILRRIAEIDAVRPWRICRNSGAPGQEWDGSSVPAEEDEARCAAVIRCARFRLPSAPGEAVTLPGRTVVCVPLQASRIGGVPCSLPRWGVPSMSTGRPYSLKAISGHRPQLAGSGSMGGAGLPTDAGDAVLRITGDGPRRRRPVRRSTVNAQDRLYRDSPSAAPRGSTRLSARPRARRGSSRRAARGSSARIVSSPSSPSSGSSGFPPVGARHRDRWRSRRASERQLFG